ncbi:type II secretion system F family protein [Corynebacterium breve]|uniref:Type II secretion system F family protein n=1 Tax=Corynebacterium breve TaxID=3049799 RepID=A0ABY8VE50_9CORY|nr:type II secretion system F family protein [Corynebacterium breve]WIM67944.1 type II secretion system F family protein [Corynebacterium breve]
MTTFIAAALGIAVPPVPPGKRILPRVGSSTSKERLVVFLPVLLVFLIVSDQATIVLACVIVGGTALYIVDSSIAQREEEREREVIAHFLGHMLTDLRAGATPAHAVAHAIEHIPTDAPNELRQVLNNAHSQLARGGGAAEALQEAASTHLRELGAVWALSDTRGIPMADLLEKSRDRIDATTRRASQVKAALTGPKTTATVLAALPFAGIGMGAMMGASPLTFLTTTGLGNALFLAGTALTSGGILVSHAIIQKAAT